MFYEKTKHMVVIKDRITGLTLKVCKFSVETAPYKNTFKILFVAGQLRQSQIEEKKEPKSGLIRDSVFCQTESFS